MQTIKVVRDRYSHTPTSFQNEPLATASPLISHKTSANLQRNVACEDVGATLINEMATGPEALQGDVRIEQIDFHLVTRLPKKKKAAPPKGRAVQAPRRGKGFTKNETESLLELLEEHLPLAKEEWEKLARLHELRYPQQKRNTDSIRRKFSSLCRTIPPTGDPPIPSDVLKSKEIRRAMIERADIGDGEDPEEEYTVDMNQEIAPFSSATPATSGSAASSLPPNSDQVEREQAAAIMCLTPHHLAIHHRVLSCEKEQPCLLPMTTASWERLRLLFARANAHGRGLPTTNVRQIRRKEREGRKSATIGSRKDSKIASAAPRSVKGAIR